MRRLAITTFLPLALLAGCQGVTSNQAYSYRFGNQWCKERAFDAGLCEQPSNFNLFGTLITGERQP
jgi:hypothetical protein